MKLHSHVYWVCGIEKYMSENYACLRVSGLFQSANHCRSRLCLREALPKSSYNSFRQIESNM
jgi:hypothetical protein